MRLRGDAPAPAHHPYGIDGRPTHRGCPAAADRRPESLHPHGHRCRRGVQDAHAPRNAQHRPAIRRRPRHPDHSAHRLRWLLARGAVWRGRAVARWPDRGSISHCRRLLWIPDRREAREAGDVFHDRTGASRIARRQRVGDRRRPLRRAARRGCPGEHCAADRAWVGLRPDHQSSRAHGLARDPGHQDHAHPAWISNRRRGGGVAGAVEEGSPP